MLGGLLIMNLSCRKNLVGPASHSVEISAYDAAALESPSRVAVE